MNSIKSLMIFLAIALNSCKSTDRKIIYKSVNLEITQLSESTYEHTSFLVTDNFGKVGCNGMIVIDNNEALIIDTPVRNEDSEELIDWIEQELNCKIKGVVATHFHNDCLGGLKEFHSKKIPSYATKKTIKLATQDSVSIPKIELENYSEIKVGEEYVIADFFGEGHSSDNIVAYFPKEKVLFGGCLIKSKGASKGYLGDANTNEWSNTVQAVKMKYKDATIVIPGHGKHGAVDLLDYTIDLFKN